MARDVKSLCRLLDSVTNNQPTEQMFLADLKRSIELTADRNQTKPSRYYKPSSMNCIRNMWYQRVGQEQDKSVANYSLVGIGHSGTDIHVRIQQAVCDMMSNGIDCEYIDVADFVRNRQASNQLMELEIISKSGMETKLFHRGLNLSFLCDGIIRYKGQFYILEIKTETSFKWQSRKGVDPKHYMQGTAYSICFELPRVLFLYITRDVLDMKTFMFEPTDEMKQSLVGKICECDDYVRDNKCPPKPDDVPKSTCEYCSYRGSCRMEID